MTRAHPLLMLGAGAALACGALFLMSQAGGPASYGSWGPPKKGVVHLLEGYDGYNSPPFAQLPAGQLEFVIYTVPPDRWLTVTAAEISTRLEGQSGNVAPVLWGEKSAGNFTLRGNGGFTLGGGAVPASPAMFPPPVTGWVFRPGSDVVVRRMTGDPTANNAWNIQSFALSGYTTRD